MSMQSSMVQALRLTRMGKLSEATAAIRSALGTVNGGPSPVDAPVLTPSQPLLGSTLFQPDKQRSAPPAVAMEARRHAGAHGTIDYLLYAPAGATGPLPLVVMLHGCTQSPEDFAVGTGMNRLADELGFAVAYPRQPQSANMQKCWNWFQPKNQSRGSGEPALIAGLTRDIIADGKVDADRIYVAGLSAGGAAAAIMADAYPDIFAAVGVHSGLACGAAHDVASALTAMKRGAGSGQKRGARTTTFVPVITVHGDRDTTVDEVNAGEIVARATAAAGVPLTNEIETGIAGGKRYSRSRYRDPSGYVLIERWTIAGGGHMWAGGNPAGSYAEAGGLDASRAMMDFFLRHTARTRG